MRSQNKTNYGIEWKHPVPKSLLKQYKFEKTIRDIIEIESSCFLEKIKDSKYKIFDKQREYIPIESIASVLNISIDDIDQRLSAFDAIIQHDSMGLKVFRDSNKRAYFRFRFSLAHEIAHLVLRQLTGPFNFLELSQTKGTNNEEEVICDLFAAALLMPKEFLTPYIHNKPINTSTINLIAKNFKVTKVAVLKRIAELTNSVLLLWDETDHPLENRNEVAERVVRIYKPYSELLNHYIPLYCTAKDERFDPNVILGSYTKGQSFHGKIHINKLGTLPSGNYYVDNMFFQYWNDELINIGLVDKRRHFFNMATLIKVDSFETTLES